MIHYPGGKPMPANVLSSIRYVAKVGILSTRQWQEYFGKGNLRWQQKQLQTLAKKDLLKRHSANWKGYWVLGPRGKDIALKEQCDPVSPVQPTYFVHDMLLGDSMIHFEKAKLTENWMTEKEMKQDSENFELRTRDGKIKYPDIICEVKLDGEERVVAIEYERTGKSFQRYNDILRAYTSIGSIDLIIFITENREIQNRIRKAQKKVGNYILNTKLAYVGVNDWTADPTKAHLDLDGKRIVLGDVCDRYT